MYTSNDGTRFLPLTLRRDFDRDSQTLYRAFQCLARLSEDRWIFSRAGRYPIEYRRHANAASALKGKGYIALPSLSGINLPLLHRELHHFLRSMQVAFRTDQTARATFEMIAKHSVPFADHELCGSDTVIDQIKEAKRLTHKLRRATKLPRINSSVPSGNAEPHPS